MLKSWVALIDMRWRTLLPIISAFVRLADKLTGRGKLTKNLPQRQHLFMSQWMTRRSVCRANWSRLTDRCYDRQRKVEGSRKFPLRTSLVWLIFNDDIFEFNVLRVRDIIGKAHAVFGHLILPAQEVLSIGLERVEYGRTNQQIAKRRIERRVRSSCFVSAGWTNLNVETISVRVRTFCFFIVASSTHGLGQHQTSGESARANGYFSLITKLTCCYKFPFFYSILFVDAMCTSEI